MDTDACEPYSISIPCVPFFACAMQQEPLSFLFSRLNFCRRVRHWMLDTAKAESLFDLCEKAISNNDEESFRKVVLQLEDCIDKQKLKAMANIRWTGMSVKDVREKVIRMIDEGTLQS